MLTILQGDWIDNLRTLPDCSVQCCVTSPPYWGLRDYGVEGQLGLEKTPEEYVAKLVAGFREVRRVLRQDGTLWMNIGDSYASTPPGNKTLGVSASSTLNGVASQAYRETLSKSVQTKRNTIVSGLKPKDLVGIPWMLAFALRSDGWFLRQDIIWHKPNPMPESVTDRCTKAHEYIFLLTKSHRYFYDADAIREKGVEPPQVRDRKSRMGGKWEEVKTGGNGADKIVMDGTRNRRSVWTVNTEPYPESHFATFPTDLIKPCILAGCPAGGTVLDPFGGSGTTGQVALEIGRRAILIELNPQYVKLIRQRTNVTPGLPL